MRFGQMKNAVDSQTDFLISNLFSDFREIEDLAIVVHEASRLEA
jgi:hypothetical protein